MSNEADVINDILAWSKNRPLWQQYALYKLYYSTLIDSDIKEFVSISKGNQTNSQCLSESDIKSTENATSEISLTAITDVVNVNALAPNQYLPVNPNGMTVVYGDNGSGKSGYIRILKQSCRARNKGIVLKNIYGKNDNKTSATIKYKLNGKTHELQWADDQTLSSPLSAISIFDSSTANVHVDNTNDIAYLPFSMEILLKLADTCKKVAAELKSEVEAIKNQTPKALLEHKINPNTAAGQLIENLTGETKTTDVETLSSLNDRDEKRYETLCIDLAVNPEKTISDLNYKLKKLGEISSRATKVAVLIDKSNFEKLKSLKDTYLQRQEASKLAASELFHEEPLQGVGSESWKMLWDAAKLYSEQIAYPQIEYPNTSDSAKCVLCQRNLDEESSKRMQKFHAFIINDTKQKEESALKEYQEFLKNLKSQNSKLSLIKAIYLFIKDQLGNEELSKKIREFFIKSLYRSRLLLREASCDENTLDFPHKLFDDEKTSLNDRLKILTSADLIKTREFLVKEKNEIEAKKTLLLLKDDLIAEIGRRKTITKLEFIIKQQTTTDGITRKSTEISKFLITDALRAQFSKEIDELKISSLAIELQQTGSGSASPLFKVALTRSPKTKVGNILSEGEFRCVAIAAFMAELSTTNNKSGIVFDDPISSLDHRHREYVAERLAKEALTRQIVIFTHNIEFLLFLNEACQNNNAEITFEHLTKRPHDSSAGIHNHGAPPKAQSVDMRIKGILNRLSSMQDHYEQGRDAEWNSCVRSLHDDLRYIWERAVEDSIKPVLSRFSNQVKTPGFIKLTCITKTDCESMRDAMTRISQWHHSDGVDLNRNLPTPKDIETEIETVGKWFNDIKTRQEATKPV